MFSTPYEVSASTASNRQVRLKATYRNLTLWTLQGWLAMFFIAAGYTKLTQPFENLILLLKWPQMVSPLLVTGVGALEIILAVGVLTPLATWRLRIVAVGSAAALAILSLVMLAVHLYAFDLGLAGVNFVLAGFSMAIVLGRRGRARSINALP